MDHNSETTKLKIAEIGADLKSFGTFAGDAVVEDIGFGVAKDLDIGAPIDPEAEAQLVRKLDARLLPCLGLMFLFNSLDKTNLGNAKTAGLEKSLGLHGNQFNLLVIIFYLPYVWTAPFLAVAGKKIGVHRALPLMMATFGVATLGIAAVSNFTGLLVLRWILGVAESAFFPLVIYYLTTFYRRGELARRMALFYVFSFSASALGGLLAVWTLAIRNGPLPSWKYLFILEGASTLLYSLLAFWWLPANAGAATFLSEEEKMLAYYRMQVDSSAVVNDQFVFSKAVKVLKHPTSWVILAIEACIGVPLMSVSLFLPVMISGLGYSATKTNMLTVGPNLTGACMLLVLAYASDYTRHRFSFAALGFALTFSGFIIFATIDVTSHVNLAYFATFLMTAGTSGPSVILDIWYNNNIAVESQRILLTSLACPIANSMGLLSGSIFFANESPRYPTALRTTAAFGVTGCGLTLALGLWMMIDNKRRDQRQGRKVKATEVPTTLLANGPESDDYRWML